VASETHRSAELGVLSRPLRGARRERFAGPRIAALATSEAPDVLTQEQVLERLRLTGDEFAEGIFARCGVQRRHLQLDDDFMARTLQGRTERIEHDLLEHSIRAVEALELEPAAVRTLVSSSLYTLACPTLAHRLVDHFQLAPTTDKYHVSGVGCASAVPLMRFAAQSLRDEPGGQALVVAADSMSGILMQATPDDPRAQTVGSAIFGDGCAAALLSADPGAGGPAILASQVHQIAGTMGSVVLDVSSESAYLHLARELPDQAAADVGTVVDGFLERNGLDRSAIEHWMVHPGGRRIVASVEEALGLAREDVATSWDVLADYGNVGTPAIFYVLKRTIEQRQPEPGDHGLMVTIGPGVTVGLMLLGW